MNHGLILDPIVENKDYVFGASKKLSLGGEVLRPDGQWDDFLPLIEMQNKGFEPSACVSFGTLSAVEMLEKFEFGDVDNYSDRFLAYASGTTPQGNSPQKVAEKLKEVGCVHEAEWPYTDDLNTWDKYYKTPPQNLYTSALTFKAEYRFGHEYVPTDPASMMEALKYSPLGVAVYAWSEEDKDGIIHRPQFAQSNHWCIIYGFKVNEYWLCLDSYGDGTKKLAWDFGFEQVKRYTLHRQIVDEGAWAKFLALLKSILGVWK